MKTNPEIDRLNDDLVKLLRPVRDEILNRFHPSGEPGYYSIQVDVNFRSSAPEPEWMIYCGGSAQEYMGCICGKSVQEIFAAIAGFDPEEKKRREIAALKARLEKLENPVPVADFSQLDSAVRG